MKSAIVVTGTDTDIGKTVFAAALCQALAGSYWKPVQAGTDGGTDRETVKRLTGLGEERLLAERYVLSEALSPHRAAEIDGLAIDFEALVPLPAWPGPGPLIIEGAGGLMVPLNREHLMIDLIGRWQAPVVLCARTALGTINHSLLSVEALKRRSIPLLGIAFIGEPMPDTERTIIDFAGVKRLGRLPRLDPLDPAGLGAAFTRGFAPADFGTEADA
ncbi:MAG: dethiobiotin synthase [Defluviicoccus sp.]